jgi:cell division protein FtsL
MAPAATQAARTAAAPARSPRASARRRPTSSRAQTARRPRTARPYAGTPMPARLVPIAVGRTAGAVSGLAELGVVHQLTRGRLWIGALASLLVGIVALNVVALSFNASSSKATRQTDVLERQISTLRAQSAATGASSERVQSLAAKLGMTVPEPGAIGYVSTSSSDAARAAERLAAGQIRSGPVPAAPGEDAATTTTTVTDPAAVTTETIAPPATTVP